MPRIVAIEAALEQLNISLPENVNKDHILVGGHSLGAGYALVVLDRILSKGWGQETVFVSLESSYARPVQEDLQIGTMNLPEEFLAHVVVSEDDLSVNDCFGVHHHELLGHGSLFIEIPSDKYGFPRLVATHYIQATETHDTHADWGFYRRVANQAECVRICAMSLVTCCRTVATALFFRTGTNMVKVRVLNKGDVRRNRFTFD